MHVLGVYVCACFGAYICACVGDLSKTHISDMKLHCHFSASKVKMLRVHALVRIYVQMLVCMYVHVLVLIFVHVLVYVCACVGAYICACVCVYICALDTRISNYHSHRGPIILTEDHK